MMYLRLIASVIASALANIDDQFQSAHSCISAALVVSISTMSQYTGPRGSDRQCLASLYGEVRLARAVLSATLNETLRETDPARWHSQA